MFIYGGCGGKKNNFKTFHECNGAVSLTKVSQMCIYKLLLNSFPTGITCLYSTVLPNAPRIIESPSRGGGAETIRGPSVDQQ